MSDSHASRCCTCLLHAQGALDYSTSFDPSGSLSLVLRTYGTVQLSSERSSWSLDPLIRPATLIKVSLDSPPCYPNIGLQIDAESRLANGGEFSHSATSTQATLSEEANNVLSNNGSASEFLVPPAEDFMMCENLTMTGGVGISNHSTSDGSEVYNNSISPSNMLWPLAAPNMHGATPYNPNHQTSNYDFQIPASATEPMIPLANAYETNFGPEAFNIPNANNTTTEKLGVTANTSLSLACPEASFSENDSSSQSYSAPQENTSSPAPDPPPQTSTPGQFKCRYQPCTAVFRRNFELKRHENSKKHRPNAKSWTCPISGCEKSTPGNGYSRPDKLPEHMRRVHSELGYC